MANNVKIYHVGNRHVELTPHQRHALLLWGRTPGWKRSAYPGVNLTTVYALQRRNFLASCGEVGSMAFPTNAKYRLTNLGLAVFEVLSKESA